MSALRPPLRGNLLLFVELRVLLTGNESVSFRAEGHTAESIVLAFTTLAGDLDETARALCQVMLRENGPAGFRDTDAAIDRCLNVAFKTPLVGHLPVEVASNRTVETVTMVVTTTSLGAMVGSLFVHFSGGMGSVRTVLTQGYGTDCSGVELSTNIPTSTLSKVLPVETFEPHASMARPTLGVAPSLARCPVTK